MLSRTYILALAAAALPSAYAHARQADCTVPSGAKIEVERTVHAFFDALQKEDKAEFRRVTTASFHSFDAGKRFAGTELLDVVLNAHARGVQLNWSLGPFDTKLRCNVAWSAWENTGTAGIPPDLRPAHWLESAVLVHQEGRWQIDLFHSQRASEK